MKHIEHHIAHFCCLCHLDVPRVMQATPGRQADDDDEGTAHSSLLLAGHKMESADPTHGTEMSLLMCGDSMCFKL